MAFFGERDEDPVTGDGWVVPWLKSKKESMSKFSVLTAGLLPMATYGDADIRDSGGESGSGVSDALQGGRGHFTSLCDVFSPRNPSAAGLVAGLRGTCFRCWQSQCSFVPSYFGVGR